MLLKKISCLLLISRVAFCLPEQAIVTHGNAHLNQNGSALDIAASDRAIIDWNSFSIQLGETVRFLQPSMASAVLNRVTGAEISQILGSLLANGQIFLINSSGVLIGKDAIIKTASFLASTLPLDETSFLEDGDLLFQGNSTASIIHLGNIQCPEGAVPILAHKIENNGQIVARNATLTAAHEILLSPTNNPLVRIRPDLPAGGIENKGLIVALETAIQTDGAGSLGIKQMGDIKELTITSQNGRIFLQAQNIDIGQEAHLNAQTIEIVAGDRIYNEGALSGGNICLTISDTGSPLYQLGIIDTSGSQGGRIQIEAPKCLQTGALLADGENGPGGTISIATQSYIETASATLSANSPVEAGRISVVTDSLFTSGTYQAVGSIGGQIHLLGDRITLVATNIDASGKAQGGEILIGGDYQGKNPAIPNASTVYLNGSCIVRADALSGKGGKVIVWSEKTTEHYGHISANQGGLIEVSGKELFLGGTTEAVNGTVLFDPLNIIIDDAIGIYPQYQFIDPNQGNGTSFGQIILPLSTGNVVVTKPGDNFGGNGAGAVYVYNGVTAALISTLTGSTANDAVGNIAITLTGNGNFVTSTTNWTAFGNANAGAATWGSGVTGVSGAVGFGNSFLGTNANDRVSVDFVTALPNGNYVVNSSQWKNGANANAGAVTWGNGSSGTFGSGGYGFISTVNSFTGTQANDRVGIGGVVALPINSNYVVNSSQWKNGGNSGAGAVSWGNGLNGTFGPGGYGAVSAANSFVGINANDAVGAFGIIPLNNGNYVAISSQWKNGVNASAGAVTWGNGLNGTFGPGGYGVVSSSNSFVGTNANDLVGSSGVTPLLINNNYVVRSPNWANGLNGSAGAATWGNGSNGAFGAGPLYGAISSTNSIVGSHPNDSVGSNAAVALLNGNFVVGSANWNDGVSSSVGAATWGNGSTGTFGVVS